MKTVREHGLDERRACLRHWVHTATIMYDNRELGLSAKWGWVEKQTIELHVRSKNMESIGTIRGTLLYCGHQLLVAEQMAFDSVLSLMIQPGQVAGQRAAMEAARPEPVRLKTCCAAEFGSVYPHPRG
ncbi:MAG TPA: hypothetical protein V6C97_26480 [Oculatellaceae cyanobacterium]